MAGFHPADPGSSPGYGISWISESPAAKHSTLPCWRNRIARTPSKRKVAGSSPVQGTYWSSSVVVNTFDFESIDRGSIPRWTFSTFRKS